MSSGGLSFPHPPASQDGTSAAGDSFMAPHYPGDKVQTTFATKHFTVWPDSQSTCSLIILLCQFTLFF